MWNVEKIKSKNVIYPVVERRVCGDEEFIGTLVRHKVDGIWLLTVVTGDVFSIVSGRLDNLYANQLNKVVKTSEWFIKSNRKSNFSIKDNNQLN